MSKGIPVILFAAVVVVMLARRHFPSPPDPVSPGVVDDALPGIAEPIASDVPQTWPRLREGVTSALPSGDINYYIVFDGSGSMRSRECAEGATKLDAAGQAVRDFIDAAPATANIGLAAFDDRGISERVMLGAGNREALANALLRIQPGSGTLLKSGIRIGYEKLTEQARAQLGYGEYHLVVVTDGMATPDKEDPTPVVREILQDSPVVLHTIGFCIDASHVLNQPGRTYYASATNPQELQTSLRAVLAEAPTFDVARFQ